MLCLHIQPTIYASQKATPIFAQGTPLSYDNLLPFPMVVCWAEPLAAHSHMALTDFMDKILVLPWKTKDTQNFMLWFVTWYTLF